MDELHFIVEHWCMLLWYVLNPCMGRMCLTDRMIDTHDLKFTSRVSSWLFRNIWTYLQKDRTSASLQCFCSWVELFSWSWLTFQSESALSLSSHLLWMVVLLKSQLALQGHTEGTPVPGLYVKQAEWILSDGYGNDLTRLHLWTTDYCTPSSNVNRYTTCSWICIAGVLTTCSSTKVQLCQ